SDLNARKCRWAGLYGCRPCARRRSPTGPCVGTGYPAGLTERNQKRPSLSVVNLPRRFISHWRSSWFSYSPTGDACQTSTSTPSRGLPRGSQTRQETNSAGPGVSERTIEPPFSVRGEFIRQNGPRSAEAVSVAPLWPLLSRQTRVDKPAASENKMPSLWASWVAWPMRLRKSIPVSNSSSVRRTSRANACRCRTRAAITSRSRGLAAPRIAASTLSVTDASSSTMEPENLRGDTFSMFHVRSRMHVRARHRARFCSLTGEVSFGGENVRNGPARKAPAAKAIFAPSGSNGCFEIGWRGSSAVRLVTSTQAAETAPRLDACASVSLASGRTQPIESREVSGLQVVGPVPLSQPDVFAHR